MNKQTILFTALLVICNGISIVLASAGDRVQPFQRCLQQCNQRHVESGGCALPPILRLTQWTCADDCAYMCMHALTDRALQLPRPEPVLQYYGKWPFWRFMGMQEPASVLFSVANLLVHYRGYKRIKRSVPDNHPMKGYMLLWSVVSMNAWVWSAIFHTRDKPSTEKLDYFSAALVFITALHSLVSRFFLIGRPYRRRLYNLWTLLCIISYVAHVSYLTLLPRFDYDYNIKFNLTLGLSHNLLWLLYALPSNLTVLRRFPPNPHFSANAAGGDDGDVGSVSRKYRPPCASKAAIGVGLMMAAMSLELLDFPPIGRVLDAHALWHAVTAPIGEMWYSFLLEDALDEGWGFDNRKRRIEKSYSSNVF